MSAKITKKKIQHYKAKEVKVYVNGKEVTPNFESLVELVTTAYKETDKQLTEIVNYCTDGKCNVK